MSLFKTSSFAENGLNFRQFNRLEEKALQKRLDHMRTMHRQIDFNYGLEGKVITNRLKANLERSAQAEASIKQIKRSMPACSSKHYKKHSFATAKTLKEVWSDEDSGNNNGLSKDVTIPASINLLQESGYQIDKDVSRKLDEMRKAHLRMQNMKNPRKLRNNQTPSTRCKSFPTFNNKATPDIDNKFSLPNTMHSEPMSNHLPTISNGSRERLLSSSSSTSSYDITENVNRRLRSDTQPIISPVVNLKRKKRPFSAPDLETKINPVTQNYVIEPQIAEDEIMEALPSAYENNSNGDSLQNEVRSSSVNSFDSEDVRIYSDGDPNQCPLDRLHRKIHSKPEEIDLLDLHRASVASKNYPRRMKTFMRGIHGWKIPEDEKLDGLTGDYYSFRIQKSKNNCTNRGEGRRVSSAKSTKSGLPQYSDDEQEYYEKIIKSSMTDSKFRSMTIKPLSTVWGPSEYVEWNDYPVGSL